LFRIRFAATFDDGRRPSTTGKWWYQWWYERPQHQGHELVLAGDLGVDVLRGADPAATVCLAPGRGGRARGPSRGNHHAPITTG
jgi:hypothetical protein